MTRTIVAILENHQQADGSVRVPDGAAALPAGREVLEPVGAGGWAESPQAGWRPRLVALDIDGTLLKWVEGSGPSYEQIEPVLYDAVHAVLDAGAHVVLASGRSPHGMTSIADLLDLPDAVDEPLWVVASNGAVIFRYPPLEIDHEETFDASEAVRLILAEHPDALVAVEERGVGYRVNRPFPDGRAVRGDDRDRGARDASASRSAG